MLVDRDREIVVLDRHAHVAALVDAERAERDVLELPGQGRRQAAGAGLTAEGILHDVVEAIERVVSFRVNAAAYALLCQRRLEIDEEHGRRLDDSELVTALCSSSRANEDGECSGRDEVPASKRSRRAA